MMRTLEGASLVSRSRHPDDGRKVMVHLEESGLETIEAVFPRFNEFEAKFTARLEPEERRELARLLRLVTATADQLPLVDQGSEIK
jgi:DNA-binding MarR family transcriptional regulator